MEVPDGTEIIYVCNICNATGSEMDIMQDNMTSPAFTGTFHEMSSVSSAIIEKHESMPERKPIADEAAQKLLTMTITLLLIEVCKKHDSDFESSVKKYMWQKIAELITKESGLNITATCNAKKGLIMNAGGPSTSSPTTSNVSTDSERSMTLKSAVFQPSFPNKRKRLENPVERIHQVKMSRQDRYLDIVERLTKAVEKVGERKFDNKDLDKE